MTSVVLQLCSRVNESAASSDVFLTAKAFYLLSVGLSYIQEADRGFSQTEIQASEEADLFGGLFALLADDRCFAEGWGFFGNCQSAAIQTQIDHLRISLGTFGRRRKSEP